MGCTSSKVSVVHEIKRRPSTDAAGEGSTTHKDKLQHIVKKSRVEQITTVVGPKEANGTTDDNRPARPNGNSQNSTEIKAEELDNTETFLEQPENEELDNDEPVSNLPDLDTTAVDIHNDSGKRLSPKPGRVSLSLLHHRHGPSNVVDSAPDIVDNRPHPAKYTKEELIPDPKILVEVDKHALEAPPNVKSSVKSLREYLVEPFKTDLQKVRAFYRWIAENISYDVKSYFGGKIGACDAESVLRSGKSVCQGYSELFSALCQDADIKCLLVPGFLKGYGYSPNIPFKATDQPDHVWNLVCLESDWYLVDCTRASGQVNNKNQYIKQFEEGYFLTDPRHFISNHFPWTGNAAEDSRLQLLEQPVTLDEYNERLNVTVYSMANNVEFISHSKKVISFDNRTEITLRLQPNTLTNVIAHVYDSSNVEMKGCVMIQEEPGGLYRINLSAPDTKFEGTMSIFGADRYSEQARGLSTYIVHCNITDPARVPKFPDNWGKWGLKSVESVGFTDEINSQSCLSAKDGELTTCFKTIKDVDIMLHIEDADGQRIGRASLMTPNKNGIQVRVRCPTEGYYKLEVFNSNGTSYDFVGSLLIHSLGAFSPFVPFPETFDACQKHRVTLLQPLDGHLLPETEYKFQIHSPLTKQIMLRNTVVKDSSSGIFEINLKTTQFGDTMTLFGSMSTNGALDAYFKFYVA